jgi:hypothetical protein
MSATDVPRPGRALRLGDPAQKPDESCGPDEPAEGPGSTILQFRSR